MGNDTSNPLCSKVCLHKITLSNISSNHNARRHSSLHHAPHENNNNDNSSTSLRTTRECIKHAFVDINVDDKSFTPKYIMKTDDQKNILEKSLLSCFVANLLTKDEIDQLIYAMEAEKFIEGSSIIVQGDMGDYFYVIEEGTVSFYVNDEKVDCVGRGHSFGEQALLFDSPRNATAIADTDAVLWKLDRSTFRYMMAKNKQEEMETVVDVLRRVPFIKELRPGQIKLIVDVMTVKSFAAGERLVVKGTEGDLFYIVKDGRIKIHDIGFGESTFNDIVLDPGDFFGEKALVTDEPRAANATAMTDGTALCLKRGDFRRLFGDGSDFSMKLVARRNILQGAPLFAQAQLPSHKFNQLMDLMDTQTFYQSFSVRSSESSFFIIEDGVAQVTVQDGSNVLDNPRKVQMLGKGDYFGANFEDHIDVEVISTITCSVLSREAIESVIGNIHEKEPEAPQLLTDVTINDFEIKGVIGDGGYGVITLASHNHVLYAIENLSKRDLIDNNKVRNVLREKQILSTLNHPFIVTIFTTFQTLKAVYIVKTHVPGGELFDVVYGSDIPGISADAAAFYSACLLETLTYLHSRNIVSRDIKPENVVLDNLGYGILFFFNLAKIVTEKTYTLCGTPEYIAPEVIASKGHDKGADYWSLGVLIFELLAGYTPFASKDANDLTLFKRIIKGKYYAPKRASFTTEARDLIKNLLEKKQHHRLGCLAGGGEDVKNHAFFEDIDWQGLYERVVLSPFVPECSVGGNMTFSHELSEAKQQLNFQEEVTLEEDLLFVGI